MKIKIKLFYFCLVKSNGVSLFELIGPSIKSLIWINGRLVIGFDSNQPQLTLLWFHLLLSFNSIWLYEVVLASLFPSNKRERVGFPLFCGGREAWGERHNGINEGMNWWNVLPRCKRSWKLITHYKPTSPRSSCLSVGFFALSSIPIQQSNQINFNFCWFDGAEGKKRRNEMARLSSLLAGCRAAAAAHNQPKEQANGPLNSPTLLREKHITKPINQSIIPFHSIINFIIDLLKRSLGRPPRKQFTNSISLPILKEQWKWICELISGRVIIAVINQLSFIIQNKVFHYCRQQVYSCSNNCTVIIFF